MLERVVTVSTATAASVLSVIMDGIVNETSMSVKESLVSMVERVVTVSTATPASVSVVSQASTVRRTLTIAVQTHVSTVVVARME